MKSLTLLHLSYWTKLSFFVLAPFLLAVGFKSSCEKRCKELDKESLSFSRGNVDLHSGLGYCRCWNIHCFTTMAFSHKIQNKLIHVEKNNVTVAHTWWINAIVASADFQSKWFTVLGSVSFHPDFLWFWVWLVCCFGLFLVVQHLKCLMYNVPDT